MRTLLSREEKRRLGRLLLALPLFGTIDALGLAAIIAVFLHIVGVHVLVRFHVLHTWLAGALHFPLSERALGLVLLVAIAVARFAGGLLTQYLIFRFCFAVQARLSADFLRAFLATDVDYIAGKDKAFGVQIVFNECARYASGVLQNGLQVAYESLTLLLFAGVLIYASPVISLLFVVVAAVVFLVVRYVSENFTQLLGERRLRSDGARFSLITEAFQGFDEIAIYGLTPGLVRRYESATTESLRTTLLQQLLNLLPRNLFEFLVVLALLGIALSAGSSMSPNLLSTMAILLGAAFRCMPSINRILSSGQMIAFEIPVVHELAALRDEAARAQRPSIAAAARLAAYGVQLPGVQVRRCSHNRDFQLNIAPLELAPADVVLIMGDSGCGKTTYLASVAGLLNQTQHRRAAQVRVSYAPQTAFVLNDTLEANITLAGLLPGKQIDAGRLLEAMRVAQLLEPASGKPLIPPGTQLDGSGRA